MKKQVGVLIGLVMVLLSVGIVFAGCPSGSCSPGNTYCYTDTDGGHQCTCQNNGKFGPKVNCADFNQGCSCEGYSGKCDKDYGNSAKENPFAQLFTASKKLSIGLKACVQQLAQME